MMSFVVTIALSMVSLVVGIWVLDKFHRDGDE